MRILLVTMDYPPPMGGIQVVTQSLEEDLKKAGHAVGLLNFDGRNSSNYRRLRVVDFFYSKATANQYFHWLNIFNPFKLKKPSGFRDFVYNNMIYRETLERIRSFRPDLIHILKPVLYPAVFECGIPFIVSCHGTDVSNILPVKYALENAAAVHCVSEYMKGLVASTVPDAQRKTRVIPNSVDLCMYSKEDAAKEKIILSCCRLVKRKNIDTVIRAFQLLPEPMRSEYKYAIIGDGPELKNLKLLAKELNLTNILFLGELYGQRKVDWLCRAKLFVLCPRSFASPFETGDEGFGISYIEAEAAGTPVIGSDQGGIPEAVGNGGILIHDPENPGEIAANIENVITNQGYYLELQKNCLSRITRFDRPVIFRKYEELYHYALSH